jgi:outer membrane protein
LRPDFEIFQTIVKSSFRAVLIHHLKTSTMKNVLKTGSLLVFLMLIGISVQAQKYGYVNSALILSELPEVKQMRSNLESFQTQLQKKGQQMLTDYQAKEQDAVQKEQAGQLSPVEKETVLKELQEKQEELIKYEQEMQQKLSKKEQELLTPILDNINSAIQAVAEEGNYTFIFDSSSGVILYADETSDVTSKVKAKL